MRLTGPGVWDEPGNQAEARLVLRRATRRRFHRNHPAGRRPSSSTERRVGGPARPSWKPSPSNDDPSSACQSWPTDRPAQHAASRGTRARERSIASLADAGQRRYNGHRVAAGAFADDNSHSGLVIRRDVEQNVAAARMYLTPQELDDLT